MRQPYLILIILLTFSFGLQAQINVTFRVDLNSQVSVDSASVAGNFQNLTTGNDWTPGADLLTDGDMDGVYETTVSLASGTYEYKFINHAMGMDNWEQVPSGCAVNSNRQLVLGANDTTLDIVCIGTCDPMCPANVDTINVTLQVDLSFSDSIAPVVSVAGSFQGKIAGGSDWTPGQTVMTDPDNDSLYTVTVRIPEGTYQYKFINGDAWGRDEQVPSACAAGNNREMVVMDNDTTIPSVCFGTCDALCSKPLPPVNVTFRVNMEDEIVSNDGLFVAGSFQDPSWQKNVDQLTASMANSDYYEFTASIVPGEYQYKFFNGDFMVTDPNNSDVHAETGDFLMGGCGVDNGFGGSNRLLDISGQLNDTILPVYKYNTCDESFPGGIGTDIEDDLNALRSVKVFPNPFTGETTVTFSNDEGKVYKAEILNMNGQVIRSYGEIRTNKLEISSKGLTNGMYFLTLRNRAGEVYTEKLIVK